MRSRLSSYRRFAAAAVLAAIPLVAPVSAASVPASMPAAALGPPAICHPIHIGDAESLPWGGGSRAFAADPDYDVARTVDDTLAILRASDDTLVHMETIRRATIYLTGMEGVGGKRSDEWRLQTVQRLVTALQTDATAIQARADATAADGLKLFDFGYLLAVMAQSGNPKLVVCEQASKKETALKQAALLRPDDGAVHLGYALATYDHQGGTPACYAHLDRAVVLATDPDGLLRRNLMSTMGGFLEASSYDDLAAKVSARCKRA